MTPHAVAYEDGRQACLLGVPYSENPYRDSALSSAWAGGYHDAEIAEADGQHFRTPKETR